MSPRAPNKIGTKIRKCAVLKGVETVQEAISVTRRTIEWKNSSTRTSTRPSFVRNIWMRTRRLIAITKSFARLHTRPPSCQLIWLNSTTLTWTFTCIISKRYGVRTEKMITIEKFVFMHTTGKIIDADLLCSLILPKCAQSAKRAISFLATWRGALISTCVPILMAGRNKSTTLTS